MEDGRYRDVRRRAMIIPRFATQRAVRVDLAIYVDRIRSSARVRRVGEPAPLMIVMGTLRRMGRGDRARVFVDARSL